MIQLILCAMSAGFMSQFAPNIMVAPLLLFALDHWMAVEARKEKEPEKLPLFTKITLFAPLICIWAVFLWSISMVLSR